VTGAITKTISSQIPAVDSPQHPASQIVCSIEMRRDRLLETRKFVFFPQSLRPLLRPFYSRSRDKKDERAIFCPIL
jgi:hypothetical protein